MILHAGLVALRVQGRWLGALITGSSGLGKSDLMVRAFETGFRLVADDRTVVWASDGLAFGRAPQALDGLIELRGLGVVSEPALPLTEIGLVVRCEQEPPERMPEPELDLVAGLPTPVLRLTALEASAPAKLGRALSGLRRLGHGRGAA